MDYITNKTELKNYIFRQLGSEAHRVEISDSNWNDIYNKTMNFAFERVDDAVIRKTAIIQTYNQKDLILDSKIMSINRLLGDSKVSSTVSTYAYAGISPLYDLIRGDVYDTTTFLIMTERVKEYSKLFNEKVDYNFNSQSKRLIIHSKNLNSFMIDYNEIEDETLLYENEMVLKYAEMMAWKTWARNVGAKYQGSTIGNGVTLNFDYMISEADKLKEEIDNDIENETYDMLLPRPIYGF